MLRRPPRPASSRPPAERTAEADRAATTTVEDRQAEAERPGRDPGRPVYVISVAAGLVAVHPRTLRIYEGEGLICPARTPSNIRLYSENDIRRVLWIRHLTQNLGVNLAGVRVLFELEERLGMRILEQLYSEGPITRPAPGEEPDAAGTSR